jgi:hypothetical protein
MARKYEFINMSEDFGSEYLVEEVIFGLRTSHNFWSHTSEKMPNKKLKLE